MRPRAAGGFVAIEWVAAVTLLLMPAVVLTATMPTWAERRHAATVAAREAVRELDREWPAVDPARAEAVAQLVASDHGVAASDVEVRIVEVSPRPGGQIRVQVRVRMPAVVLPGLTRARAWTYTASASARVDDYRSD
jgi:hypothetical protein